MQQQYTHRVEIYGRKDCPWCQRALVLAESRNGSSCLTRSCSPQKFLPCQFRSVKEANHLQDLKNRDTKQKKDGVSGPRPVGRGWSATVQSHRSPNLVRSWINTNIHRRIQPVRGMGSAVDYKEKLQMGNQLSPHRLASGPNLTWYTVHGTR